MKTKPKEKPATRRPRYQDWPTRLFAFIEARRSTPFAWGEQDCCLFACDGVQAQTGLDPAAKVFRDKYRDALGATRLLRKHGGVEAIAARLCGQMGFRSVPVGLAQRGDVVLLAAKATGNPGAGPAIGICVGAEAAFPGTEGLVFLPSIACRRAWRVG